MVEVTHILSRIWFLQILSQQLSRHNKLGVWEDCCRPKCLSPHSRKRTRYFSRTNPHGRWRWRSGEWKGRWERRWRVQSGESKRGQNKHCAWGMDDVMRTNILSQCPVRHWNVCRETRENAMCEGVLFTPSVGCSRLLSAVNDPTTTFFFLKKKTVKVSRWAT